ncbi:hypothetical protein C8Q77DRAFT_1130469 [Trametes polyzona]|nr:hypothetical protein C8Q77DRAFT_1130469 [Trametes polyzona]
MVSRPEFALRQQKLEDELRQLKEASTLNPGEGNAPMDIEPSEPVGQDVVMDIPEDVAQRLVDAESSARPRRLQPDDNSKSLYAAWIALIPTLVPAYLMYLEAAQGRTRPPSTEVETFICPQGSCSIKTTSVLCLHFQYLVNMPVQYCQCVTVPQRLVSRGLFPSSPQLPRVAIHIDLLDFYFALFERSADAVTALAGALKSIYVRRGFPILNDKGEPVQDPFRRGLGSAVQWYDQLRNLPEAMVDCALDESLQIIYADQQAPADTVDRHAHKHTTAQRPVGPAHTGQDTTALWPHTGPGGIPNEPPSKRSSSPVSRVDIACYAPCSNSKSEPPDFNSGSVLRTLATDSYSVLHPSYSGLNSGPSDVSDHAIASCSFLTIGLLSSLFPLLFRTSLLL